MMKNSSRGAMLLATAALLVASTGDAARTKYTQIPVTNGGTISGRVVWEGDRVTIAPMIINKNKETCDTDGTGVRMSRRLLVSRSGGIANAVIYIDSIAEGKAMEPVDLLINQEGCRYRPHITIAPRKSKITLKSSDEILHNIHMLGAATYNIPFPDKNSITKTFRKVGLVRVQCDAGHGWMSAYIHVVNHPYYAVSDEEGNFKLTDVPPGDYTLKMWHEDWVVINEITKEGEITGYEYGEPIEKSRKVKVDATGDTKVEFSLSK